MPKIQYSINPNQSGHPFDLLVDGKNIFSDSGSRTPTYVLANIVEVLSKELGFEVEDISPQFKRKEGTHATGDAPVEWMKNCGLKNTHWVGADNPRDLLIGFACINHNIGVNVRIDRLGTAKEMFHDREKRTQFANELNERSKE